MSDNFDPSDPLAALSDRLADGEAIAWEEEEARHPALRGRLRALRMIESLGAAHGAQLSADEGLFRWGPLRVDALVASGSFAEVYRAYDPRLQRTVALKLLRASASELAQTSWLGEARRLARVRHPHVLLVLDAACFDGRAGIWSEFLEGRTLERIVREDGVLGAREAAAIGLDLCGALSAVHAAGLVHGDVKAANVMRETGGRLVLMDFGSGQATDVLASGALTGSPLYCAPEVLRGEASTPTSDVYALGVLLHWLVSAAYPFEAESVEALQSAHASASARALRSLRPDLPTEFVAVVERATSLEPATRIRDGAELERALRRCTESTEIAAPRTARPRRWALVAMTVLALAVASTLLLQRRAASFEHLLLDGSQLAVQAQMLRYDGERRAPLSPGSALAPNERLSMQFRSDVDAHVYVLNEDQQGELFVLFPVEGLALQNPLRGGMEHLLPGELRGRTQDWIVTSAGGSERFLTIASREPLPELEQRIARWNRVRRDRAVQSEPGDLRGVGGMGDGSEREQGPSALRQLVEELAQASADREGLWVWEARFRNP